MYWFDKQMTEEENCEKKNLYDPYVFHVVIINDHRMRRKRYNECIISC